MRAMVPIGAAVWSKKTAHLAALAAYLVLSTVSLGCRVKIGRRRIVAWRQHLLPAGNKIQALSSRPRGCFATPRSPRLARRCLRLGACKKTGARSFPRARNFAWGVGSERERGSTQRRSSCVLAHKHFLGPGVGVTLRPVCPTYRRVSGARPTKFWRECRALLV